MLGERATTWSVVSPQNPTVMARGDVDGDHVDDLIAGFGAGLGVWIFTNGSTPRQLHPFDVTHVVVGDFDANGLDDVVLGFPAFGLWTWMNGREWHWLHPRNPSALSFVPRSGEQGHVPPPFLTAALAASFPGEGVQIGSGNPGVGALTWTPVHPLEASLLAVTKIWDDPGPQIVIAFAGQGLWVYSPFSNRPWTLLHPFDVRRVTRGDLDGTGHDDLVIDFGEPWGLWILANGTTWTHLHGLGAQHTVLADLDGRGRDEVMVDFGAPHGVWTFSTVTRAWQFLRNVRLEGLLPGTFHGDRLR